MSEHYINVHAALDPEALEEYPNGVRVQEIELTFTSDPDAPSWRQATPVACPIDARRARQLAFELLILAEHAERLEQAR
jgi:hypothetical protein